MDPQLADVLKTIIHRMSTEAQYSSDLTIKDYADVSSLIVDYRDKKMWEVRVKLDDTVSLPSDMYLTRNELTYQDALAEAERLLTDDLIALYDKQYDPQDAVTIVNGRYEVRLSVRYRKAVNTILDA